jgi:hypothetical protein
VSSTVNFCIVIATCKRAVLLKDTAFRVRERLRGLA